VPEDPKIACMNVACGGIQNNCGLYVDCTIVNCQSGQECYNNACCTPKTGTAACGTKNCGQASDTCGGQVNCGSCPTGDMCSGGTCTKCQLPNCSTIGCGLSVTVCGVTVYSCAPNCAG
jgi:hypothetical protein